MMAKSALAGEARGCTPTPFHSTITYKAAVYAPAESADALPEFNLYPVCTLWLTPQAILEFLISSTVSKAI
jgi:hypothetical protein